mmetsp:Transcript_499/g.1238  ORF Transcript_499/g.1238 Transcript_499/m.1238 type:complete len:221 (+) Transcript_499:544-1206(+)
MGRAQDWYGSPSIRLARLLRRVWRAHFISENEVCMTTYLIHDCFLRKSEVGVGERDDLLDLRLLFRANRLQKVVQPLALHVLARLPHERARAEARANRCVVGGWRRHAALKVGRDCAPVRGARLLPLRSTLPPLHDAAHLGLLLRSELLARVCFQHQRLLLFILFVAKSTELDLVHNPHAIEVRMIIVDPVAVHLDKGVEVVHSLLVLPAQHTGHHLDDR